MDHDRSVCQSVEVRDGLDQDGRGGGDADKLAIADGGEDGEQRVSIMSYCLYLEG